MLAGNRSERDELRQRILKERDALGPVEIEELSAKVCDALWHLPEFSAAQVIFLYVNFRSEVVTHALINQCLANGKIVAVPRVAEEFRLVPYRIKDPKGDLAPGSYGISEPIPEQCERVASRDIELVVLPGSVFDEHGGRLGYGGGYYDRFLVNDAPTARRLGIAFDFQVVSELFLMPHDQRLHGLVTECKILNFGI